ncbi:hypothetical protein DM860_003707 [Cuscuta australis]|uniref:Uncharacterized protein n=1 Tax=Cuscuta australis TaxID=267555 RepID=A0A328DJZ6_9ASTE|nr:hypothetical protein DM860_003707 [Cuscuta australis]
MMSTDASCSVPHRKISEDYEKFQMKISSQEMIPGRTLPVCFVRVNPGPKRPKQVVLPNGCVISWGWSIKSLREMAPALSWNDTVQQAMKQLQGWDEMET